MFNLATALWRVQSLLLAGALFFGVPAPAASTTDTNGSLPSIAQTAQGADQAVADASEFRAEFGFASDPATVLRLLSDPSSDYSFGAPLTPLELVNMEERIGLRDAAEPLVQYVESQPDAFGGLYFTQDTGKLVLHLLPVDGASADAASKALALVPQGLSTNVSVVARSMSELMDAQARLASRRVALGINQLGIDVVGNRLLAVFSPGTSVSSATAIAKVPIDASFGPGPNPAYCTNATSCTPYRGGIEIYSPDSAQYCTWGFYGTRGTTAKYLITAGHCAAVGDTESHLGVTFTDGVDQNTYQMVSRDQLSDSMTAHVLGSGNAVAPFNTIYASGTDKAHTITGQRSGGSQAVGDAVCFMGFKTGTSLCGTIEAKNLSYSLTRYDGRSITLYGQIQMSRVGKQGDSGGPMYQGHTAYGIMNAITNPANHVLYSTIDNVEADMGNTLVCLTSAC